MHHIAVLFEYPTLLGGERSLLASLERLRDRFVFVAIAPEEGDLAQALREVGVTLIPTPLLDEQGCRVGRSLATSRLIEVVRNSGADLLHANSLAMGRLTGAIASQLPIPCTAHLRDIIGLSNAAVADLSGNVALFAVSQATRDFHVAQGIAADRTTVVYTGVDLTRFHPRKRSPTLRRQLGIPNDASVVLTIGQVGLRKGWDVLADAVSLIADASPSLHVVLVGERFGSKAETVEYEHRVRETLLAAMPGRAHFPGSRDDVPELMEMADLLVHPARQEPFGRVLLEAAASGLAIVATDVGGTREMLEDGVSARLVPPGDAVALANTISALLRDPPERRRLAVAARERVEQRFSAEVAADLLADEWGRVLAASRA
jgi:glycosyltransferase involved in cell wall biosynthesis